MNRRAFTLIELVVVIIIIGIISVFSTVVISSAMRSIQLTSAANKVASDIRYAQTMANVTGTWYGVSFEVDPVNTYSIFIASATGTLDVIVNNPAKNTANFVINLKNEYNVLLTGVSIEGGGKKIEFSPIGTPCIIKNGAALVNDAVITISQTSSSRTIHITPAVGRVFVQ